MTKTQYERWSAPWRRFGAKVAVADRVLTAAVYVAYPLLLLLSWHTTGQFPLKEMWVPASWLIIVSLLRRLIDRPRPYERLNITPLIQKDTHGQSFPSRHAFSVFVIAATGFVVWTPAGAALAVVGTLLCMLRVLGGVHYPSDVLAGAAIGVLAGVVGYIWL